ncbi:hypothetical protein FACS1894137_19990 [Spirochaetia bacterium]|nr:hypothetical protein FACS1894137_19990 [Spirochaetia bacterium]
MPRIIQFNHPGFEHGHDKNSLFHKSWNTEPHKRKFMWSKGDYIDQNGNFAPNQELLFWGEWEPDSEVSEFHYRENDKFPRFLHIPYIPKVSPIQKPKIPGCGGWGWQNTDSFVFDDNFKYESPPKSICKTQTNCIK